jgi:polar amino acid transport system ATP-binding protein
MSIVESAGLRKSFGTNEVLKSKDLQVTKGEVVAIIGKSGSGKSTLLRCINGLEDFQSGALSVAGKPLVHHNAADMRELRQHVGMVFQRFNSFPHLSVGKNIVLAPRLVKQKDPAANEAHARKLLQRVAIARALAMEPTVLLCDEITSALDPELVGEVLRVVESLADEGMTLLMVTHEMNFARKVADRVIFMHQGLVHEMGEPIELFANPKTSELKQFLGALHW